MASGLAARNGGRLGVAALAAVLLLGLGLRLGEAWDGRTPVYDAAAYAAIAANLERGEGFTVGPGATQPSSNYSPGLPLLVAGIYELSGGVHERTARLALALLGTLSILFAYLTARRLRRAMHSTCQGALNASRAAMHCGGPDPHNRSSDAIAGLVAALALAVYPALLEYQGMLMGEPLAATLLSGAVLAMLWAADPGGGPGRPRTARGGAVRWLLPGLLLGALAMVRPEYLGVSALLGLVVLARPLWRAASGAQAGDGAQSAGGADPGPRGRGDREWRRGLLQAAVLLAGVALVVVPWTVRNAIALERAVPISTGGGQVLFAGTYLPSGGDPERVGAEVVERHPGLFAPQAAQRLRLEQILARLTAARYPDLETDRALSRMGKERLWDDLGERPLELAGFLAKKVWRVWTHGSRQVMRQPGWRAFHFALLALAALGLGLLAWRRRWEALLLATVLLAITALSALLVASPRRVLVMAPLLCACAGVGAVWLGAQIREVGRRTSQNGSESTPAST